jgi:plastocyanin
VGTRRLAIVATVVAAFGITPAALLAAEPAPAPEPAPAAGPPPATAELEAGATATAVQSSAGEASLQTSSKPAATRRRAATTSASATAVTIDDFFFKPKDVTIGVGESITWTNKGKVKVGHTVTGNGFDSGVLKPGDAYTHRFTSAGTFDYVCTIHPNMRGTVTVTAAGSGGGSGGGGGGGAEGSAGNAPSGGIESDAGSSSSGSGSSDGGGSLASTGLNLVLLAEIGLGLIIAGLLVRRLGYR